MRSYLTLPIDSAALVRLLGTSNNAFEFLPADLSDCTSIIDETILFRTSGDLHLAHEFSLRSSKSIDLVPGPAVYGSGQSEIGDFATVSKKGLSALCH